MKKKVKFQSVKVKFPKTLYLAATWALTDEGKLIYYPHPVLYKTPKESIDESVKIYKTFLEHKHSVLPNIMLATLELIEKKPLKKVFWENPSFQYKTQDRLMQFLKPFGDPDKYKVMVTMSDLKHGTFTAPIAFLKSVPYADVELFMQSSDWPVDPKADSFAFYGIKSINGIDIFTKEVVNKNKEEPAGKKYIN